MTTNTLIQQAWEFVENIPSRTGAMAIAGGSIADAYFGKEIKDIDVFISYTEADRVKKFVDYYAFTPVITPERFREIEDSYGELRRIRIGKQESDILSVFTGKFLGFSMDLVVVDEDDIADHILEGFDQSIKSCWFDGEFHYSDAFMKTVKSGIIFPLRNEASGYVRAWLSARKYNLELSPKYELSKHWCGYANKFNKLTDILSASTISKIEGYEEELFSFKLDRANVILMDVFMNHYKSKSKLYSRLTSIATKSIVTDHPLHNQEVSVAFESSELHKFSMKVNAVRNVIGYAGDNPSVAAASHALAPLQMMTDSQFMEGKIRDEDGREARIGKYVKKIQRKHKELFTELNADTYFDDMMKLIENRSTHNKAKVFITGSKHALTHISTKTDWTSCQKWGGFQSEQSNNYGLIANVAGSSLVAYVADERCDKDSSKWHARILVRIGSDNDVMLERVYSNRVEYYKEESLRVALGAALKEIGYNAISTPDEAMDFQGLPMWSRPYNDVSDLVTAVQVDGDHVFRGRREEIERQRRADLIHSQLAEVVHTSKLMLINTDEFKRLDVLEIPTELVEETKWLFEYQHGYGFYIKNVSIPGSGQYGHGHARVTEEDDMLIIVVEQDVPYHKRKREFNDGPRVVNGFAQPVPRRAIPIAVRQEARAGMLVARAVPVAIGMDDDDNDLPF